MTYIYATNCTKCSFDPPGYLKSVNMTLDPQGNQWPPGEGPGDPTDFPEISQMRVTESLPGNYSSELPQMSTLS